MAGLQGNRDDTPEGKNRLIARVFGVISSQRSMALAGGMSLIAAAGACLSPDTSGEALPWLASAAGWFVASERKA